MTEKKSVYILYLDDEDINLFIFKANFKSKFNIITSNSPSEALDLLELHQDKIVIVISDMRMPGMNGIEFIKKARIQHDNLHYYILTGFDYNEEIEEAIHKNIVHKFFSKPFNVQEIETEINQVLNQI